MKCLTPNKGKTIVNGAEHPYQYPCGKCDHCRRVKQQHWKLRLLLESLEHEYTSFVTFTYNDVNLKYEVSKNDATKLIKRLRKLWYNKTQKHFRYYLVSEYGSISGRSHYHAIIFGIPASEQQLFENAWATNIASNRKPKYISNGFIHARDFTAARAGYVVKYSTKFLESPTNTLGERTPEFALMSRGTKRLRTKGIGLNGISRIVDSVKNAATASNEPGSLSDFFESYVGSMRIGNSRMSICPYLKKQIYEAIRTIERQDIQDKITFAKEMGYNLDELYMEEIREQRKTDLRRARRRTRNIPLTLSQKAEELIDREQAQLVAQRKQRETQKKIKI